MDLVGNPSSVHAEGRALTGWNGRVQVAEVGATTTWMLSLCPARRRRRLCHMVWGEALRVAGVEHDAVLAWVAIRLPVGVMAPCAWTPRKRLVRNCQPETGICISRRAWQSVIEHKGSGKSAGVRLVRPGYGVGVAHKAGGPKGVGAGMKRGL
jgi:cysteine desulfurase